MIYSKKIKSYCWVSVILCLVTPVFSKNPSEIIKELQAEIQNLEAENRNLIDSVSSKSPEDIDLKRFANEVEKFRQLAVSYRQKLAELNRRQYKNKTFEEVTLQNGKVLREVSVISSNERYVVVKYARGSMKLDAHSAPKKWVEDLVLLKEEDYIALYQQEDPFEDKEEISTSGSSFLELAQKAIVVIEGDISTGTGFVCEVDGKSWIYTAVHVLSGNSKLKIKDVNGREFKDFDLLETAEGFDLMRLRLKEKIPQSIKVAKTGYELKQKMAIAALGNGGGEGVVSTEEGKIVGLSAEFIEVDSDIIPGNSGGPIIALDTGEAIGVVTHLAKGKEDLWSKGTRFTKVRRFACRLNLDHEWTAQGIGTFIKEGKDIQKYDQITRLTYAIASLQPTTAGLRLEQSISHQNSVSILSILEENEDQPVVKELYAMNNSLAGDVRRLSEADLVKKISSLMRTALNLASRSRSGITQRSECSFHRKEISASVEWRKKAIELLERRLKSLK